MGGGRGFAAHLHLLERQADFGHATTGPLRVCSSGTGLVGVQFLGTVTESVLKGTEVGGLRDATDTCLLDEHDLLVEVLGKEELRGRETHHHHTREPGKPPREAFVGAGLVVFLVCHGTRSEGTGRRGAAVVVGEGRGRRAGRGELEGGWGCGSGKATDQGVVVDESRQRLWLSR